MLAPSAWRALPSKGWAIQLALSRQGRSFLWDLVNWAWSPYLVHPRWHSKFWGKAICLHQLHSRPCPELDQWQNAHQIKTWESAPDGAQKGPALSQQRSAAQAWAWRAQDSWWLFQKYYFVCFLPEIIETKGNKWKCTSLHKCCQMSFFPLSLCYITPYSYICGPLLNLFRTYFLKKKFVHLSKPMVLNGSDLWPPGDIWQLPLTFLVVTAGRWREDATGIQQMEDKDADKHSTMRRTAPDIRELSCPKCQQCWKPQSNSKTSKNKERKCELWTFLESCFILRCTDTFFLKFLILFIYLFLAALGLCCCTWAFSSCGERGLLFLVGYSSLWCAGFSCWRAWALGTRASVVVARGF